MGFPNVTRSLNNSQILIKPEVKTNRQPLPCSKEGFMIFSSFFIFLTATCSYEEEQRALFTCSTRINDVSCKGADISTS